MFAASTTDSLNLLKYAAVQGAYNMNSQTAFFGRNLEDDTGDEDEDTYDELEAYLDLLDFQGDFDLSEDEIAIWFDETNSDITSDGDENRRSRYNDRNRNDGWDYDEVKAEFEDFFDKKDVSEFTAEDWNNFELEFERVFAMLQRGERSGKMPKEYYSKDGKSWLSYDKKDGSPKA